MRRERFASVPSIVPSVVSTPARWSSAIASMIPEPQTPVTAAANLGRPPRFAANHADARSKVSGRCVRRFPGARWPHDLRAERRPVGLRGEQSVAVAENDLGVDIDDASSPEVRALERRPTCPGQMQGKTRPCAALTGRVGRPHVVDRDAGALPRESIDPEQEVVKIGFLTSVTEMSVDLQRGRELGGSCETADDLRSFSEPDDITKCGGVLAGDLGSSLRRVKRPP
jgi:hypothetical protein